jgi:hypothetical protein
MKRTLSKHIEIKAVLRFIPWHTQESIICFRSPEPEFVNFFRSPGIDAHPGGLDSLESIPGLLYRLKIRALHSMLWVALVTMQVRIRIQHFRQCGYGS